MTLLPPSVLLAPLVAALPSGEAGGLSLSLPPRLPSLDDLLGGQEGSTQTPEVVVVARRFKPSPEWTQDRTFPGTRFWRLDYGRVEVEGWWRGKIRGGDENDVHLYQAEAEFGVWPGVQLDVYENVEQVEGSSARQEGNQIEVRLSPFDYGEVFANPVLYLEGHPRHFESDVWETRLLFGGELAPRWIGASNLKYERETGGAFAVEYGVTGGASYELAKDALRLGAEAKFEIAREAGTRAAGSFAAGPNLLWRPFGHGLKVMFTGFFGIDRDAPDFEPVLILGTQF
ncbi:MAG TPA: hypothetical protein VFI25_14900 [Planctomycetota bacterium]|jgi:hypothetical protein|nr:hypothetical protein [Planctomycetota bacterium]